MTLKIERLYAFIAKDEDGNEGIVALQTSQGYMPMVGADMDRIDQFTKILKRDRPELGYEIRLFDRPTTLTIKDGDSPFTNTGSVFEEEKHADDDT